MNIKTPFSINKFSKSGRDPCIALSKGSNFREMRTVTSKAFSGINYLATLIIKFVKSVPWASQRRFRIEHNRIETISDSVLMSRDVL